MTHQKALASQIWVIIPVHPKPPNAFTMCCLTNYLLNQEVQ